jgi:cytidylate kinase
MGYHILCDSALYRKNRETLFDIVNKNGYEIIEINLEAEYQVLLKRFDERVTNALANKSKTISNTSKDRFKELYDIYEGEKNPNAVVLRTDKLGPEEIASKVFEYIGE